MCWHGLCREPSVLSLGSASADSMSQVESNPGFDSQHHRNEAVRKEGGKEGAVSEETDWISPVR